ncbi:MAG: hypothetical protein V1769_05725, partial [Thermoplasmatota archaeon]
MINEFNYIQALQRLSELFSPGEHPSFLNLAGGSYHISKKPPAIIFIINSEISFNYEMAAS